MIGQLGRAKVRPLPIDKVLTHVAALGVDRFVAERALNHKVRDVEGVYDHYDYSEERMVALDRWARLLATL